MPSSHDDFSAAEPISGFATDSEEYAQVVRVRFGLDDIIKGLDVELVKTELGVGSLVQLLWSLAIARVFSKPLVQAIQARIPALIQDISPDEVVMLLWAEAMLFNTKSGIDVEVDISAFSHEQIVNIVFAYSLMQRRVDIVEVGRDLLVGKLSTVHAVRAVIFANHFLSQETNGLERIRAACKKLKPVKRPSWKYAFELCLACHGAASKGIEVFPSIDDLFPFDALYTSRKKAARKILFEIVRPQSVIRDLQDGSLVGVDGYTRMSRLVLAKKGLRILPIRVSEWTSLGDLNRQVKYLKRRIRNCVQQRRLFSGAERDEDFDHLSHTSDSESDSGMSY